MDYEKQVLNVLLEVHHAVGARLEIEEICKILVNKIIDIIHCSGCAIMLIEGQEVKVIAEEGFMRSLGQVKFTTDTPSIKYIIETKQGIVTGDVKNSSFSSCVPDGCSMNSLICIPVIIQDEVKGIIHLDSNKYNFFSQKDVDFVQLIASEISVIIERAGLYIRVKEFSIRDGLTGCFNRRKFEEDILQEFSRAKRYGRTFSLLMIDIDYFKKYKSLLNPVKDQ
ncbi:MAG: diguanylate cyclase [Candidatus Omnitrophica bacterium]|nr:diguanylate cyclase [Candidatus Omnitrophota bacterium]